MECSRDILANDPEGTVNKLHRRWYVKKSEVFHHGIFPFKHEGSNDTDKVLVDTKKDSLFINSDNYVYSDIYCYEMLLHFRTGQSKKILDLVLAHQVPMYKIMLAFCDRLRLIPVQEYDKDDIESIIIIDE